MIQTYSTTIRRKEMDAVLTCMVDEKIGPGELNARLIQTVKEFTKCDGAVALRSPAIALKYALQALDYEKGGKIMISALAPAWQYQTVESLGYQPLVLDVDEVTGLVNAIGGITVNSDVDYSFKCYTNPNCTINPGLNNLDGDCALAFARERMAYSSGDRHRGENQEQVIEKVFDKITSSATLISKYSDILRALSGSFETSLTTSDITSLVNMQLDDMAKWTIESYNLNGTTSGAYTYSYPNQTLSVMFPDAATIETAKAKIQAVLSGNKASSVSVLSTNLAASF